MKAGIKYLIVFVILTGVSFLCRSGNFDSMRKAAFAEFDRYFEDERIDMSVFIGPVMDVSNHKRLLFKLVTFSGGFRGP